MVDCEREEATNLQKEFEWVLNQEVHKGLAQIHQILVECARRFPVALYGHDNSAKQDKFVLSVPADQLKCVVTLTGDSITHADITFKVVRQTTATTVRTTIQSEYPWKLQQVQDAANHLQQAIYHIDDVGKHYKFRVSDILEMIAKEKRTSTTTYADELKKLEKRNNQAIAIFSKEDQLPHVINCQRAGEMWKKLITIHEQKAEVSKYVGYKKFLKPCCLIIVEVVSISKHLKDMGEGISDVAVISKIINSFPPIFAISSDEVLHVLGNILGSLQKGRTSLIVPRKKTIYDLLKSRNMKSLSPPLAEDLAISFYIQSHKLVFVMYHLMNNQGVMTPDPTPAECSVPWLNEVLVLFTVGLQLCQQLKDKICVFSQYKDFTVGSRPASPKI